MKKKKTVLPIEQKKIGVICYARVSSEKQKQEDTIARQHSINKVTLERFLSNNADKNPVHLGDFSDEGYNFEEQDESTNFWSKVIPLVKEGRISHIIATNIDRIFRGKGDELKGRIKDIFTENNVSIVTDNSTTSFSPDETQGRLTTSIMTELGTISKLELVKVMHSGRRRRLAEEGEWFLSIAPYGYRLERITDGRRKKYKYLIVDEEAEVIRKIFELYTSPYEKIGATRIAAEINKIYPSSRKDFAERNPNFAINMEWDRQSVIRLLRTNMYVGELDITFGPSKKVSGFSSIETSKTIRVDPIISRDTFDIAQKKIDAIRDKLIDERQPRKIENWLHGLIKCSLCDERLVGRLQNFRWYGCPNLHGTIYRAEDMELRVKAIIDEFIFDVVSFKKLAEKASSNNGAIKEFEKLKKESVRFSKDLEDINSQLDTLTRKNISGIIDDDQYIRLKNQINEEKSIYSEKLKFIKFKIENLSRRMGESPKTQYEKILPLVLSKGLTHQDYRKIMEGLGATVSTQKVDVFCDLSEAADDIIQELYDSGYIVLKNFKNELGWSPKRVYSKFGKTGRKVPIDWRAIVELNWTTLRGWLPEGVADLEDKSKIQLPTLSRKYANSQRKNDGVDLISN